MSCTTRPIQTGDIPLLIDYWLSADESFLSGMGADISKIPPREVWEDMLNEQIKTPLDKKKSYCIIWLQHEKPIGHSNVNNIIYGQEAFMHLHLWKPDSRQKGLGTEFVKKTIPWFFEDLKLKDLFCEPYALNTAPNKTLEKLGFRFIKEYLTIPGYLNFEQPVKRWQLSLEDFNKIK